MALKYLFQPIVENSIVHGFEKRPAQHRIEITFQKEGDMLFFQVADDGIGISPQDLGPLLRQINGEGPIQGRSFALRNIHEQLCIAYGPRDIHIESRPVRAHVFSFAFLWKGESPMSNYSFISR